MSSSGLSAKIGTVWRSRHTARFDLRAAKATDTLRGVEMRLRIAVVLIGLLLTHSLESVQAPLLTIAIVYFVALLGYIHCIQSSADDVGWVRLTLVTLARFSTYMLFLSGAIVMWASDLYEIHVLALVMVFGAMLKSVSTTTYDALVKVTDIAAISVCVAIFIWIEFHRSFDMLSFWIVSFGLLALAIYFFQMLALAGRVHAKLSKMQSGQQDIDRQRTMGQLVGGVAHDFNNLLTVVIGNLQLHHEIQDDKEQAELLQEAENAARRGADLTGQLLAFSRKSRLRPEATSVEPLVEDFKPLVGRLLGEQHSLHFLIHNVTPVIEVDVPKLQTVLINLILNARDAMPDGGPITFTATSSRSLQKPTLSLKIADRGTGIPAENMEQVFEPYFTTKPVGKGSGLGLSMAKGFVEQSGGRLELTSKLGAGTQVTLHFPAYVPEATTASVAT
jgi:signal transduction histidine kinase